MTKANNEESDNFMQWHEVCEHPSLQNLPFKIELNERGQILMSPVKVWVCNEDGAVRFFDINGELNNSNLVPSFPNQFRIMV